MMKLCLPEIIHLTTKANPGQFNKVPRSWLSQLIEKHIVFSC